jgi:hypothetical protein
MQAVNLSVKPREFSEISSVSLTANLEAKVPLLVTPLNLVFVWNLEFGIFIFLTFKF